MKVQASEAEISGGTEGRRQYKKVEVEAAIKIEESSRTITGRSRRTIQEGGSRGGYESTEK